jgi:hypothetical protein
MMSRYAFGVSLVCVFLGLATAKKAEALNFYVDGSCSTEGNGTADQCASGAGSSGSFRDPQSCFSAARAGDTCYIKNGTYVSSNHGGDPNEDGGFHVDASGTSSAPITIRNYPGHSPLLANCPLSQTTFCDHPTITAYAKSYVVFDGLRVAGTYSIFGVPGSGARGIVIRNSEVTVGWEEYAGGNWAGIRLEDQVGALVQYNNIHDIYVTTNGGQQSSGSCVKLYQNTDSIVEYNTCRNVPIPESQAGGIDDKAQATRNIHRYNWIERVNTCVRINNQLNSTGVQIYGNVCVGSAGTQRPAVRLIININGIDIHNNTFYGFAQGLQIMSEGGPVSGVRWYNNIVAGAAVNNIEAYQTGLVLSNYNSWRSGARYMYGSLNVASLSSFLSSGFDAQSSEADCQFVSTGSDFRLGSSSPCRGAGRVGGTSSGGAVDRGAYGVTTCVGNTCQGGGTAPPPPPTGGGAPASPQNLRILSSELRDLPAEDFIVPVIGQPRARLRDQLRRPATVS